MNGFRTNAELEPEKVPDAVRRANDTAVFLRRNLVQGQRKDGDLWGECRLLRGRLWAALSTHQDIHDP